MPKIDWAIIIKKYGVLVAVCSALGLGSWMADATPMFRGQHNKDIEAIQSEVTQTGEKLDRYACMQIVINYQNARSDGDANMVAYWLQQARIFNCTLPS